MVKKAKSRSMMPLILIGLGAVLMFGSVVVFMDLSRENRVVVTPTLSTSRIPYPDIHRVSLTDAKAAFDMGTAVFIDTRGEPYYSQGHIPGALSMTEDELLNRLDELSPSDWIISYCT